MLLAQAEVRGSWLDLLTSRVDYGGEWAMHLQRLACKASAMALVAEGSPPDDVPANMLSQRLEIGRIVTTQRLRREDWLFLV
jgi:hypothetical protein